MPRDHEDFPTGENTAPVAERHAELWCVHLEGPDDMQPAPSKEEAEAMAVLLNGVQSRRIAIGHHHPMKATAKPWPYPADMWLAHVEDFYKILAS
jgi:hypothetical protein